MVEDPVEINRRIERLVKRVRRRDDYGRLLAAGEVIQSIERIEDPEEWRFVAPQFPASRVSAGWLGGGVRDRGASRRGSNLRPLRLTLERVLVRYIAEVSVYTAWR